MAFLRNLLCGIWLLILIGLLFFTPTSILSAVLAAFSITLATVITWRFKWAT